MCLCHPCICDTRQEIGTNCVVYVYQSDVRFKCACEWKKKMKYWWIYSTESQKFSKNLLFILSRSSSNQQKGAYNSVYCVCVSKSKCVAKVAKNGVYHDTCRWIYCDKQETLTTNNLCTFVEHMVWMWAVCDYTVLIENHVTPHASVHKTLHHKHCTLPNYLYLIIEGIKWVSFLIYVYSVGKKYAATATHHR